MATRETGGGQSKSTRRQDEVDEGYVSDEESTDVKDADVKERHEKLSDDVDAILDEIDEVLEENAEEFVRQYVQKGGQ
jgi:ubiquitin-like protein Pup